MCSVVLAANPVISVYCEKQSASKSSHQSFVSATLNIQYETKPVPHDASVTEELKLIREAFLFLSHSVFSDLTTQKCGFVDMTNERRAMPTKLKRSHTGVTYKYETSRVTFLKHLIFN